MSERTKDLGTIKIQGIEKHDQEYSQFSQKIIRLGALAFNRPGSDDFDLATAESEFQGGLKKLAAKGGLQEMLTAQMLSIHRLQQICMSMCLDVTHMNTKQYLTNSAIKLANTFIQQANLLSRLQGNGGQKITVERVDVHHGGQAVVGNINGSTPTHEVKK